MSVDIPYRLIVHRDADNELARFPRQVQDRITEAISELPAEPRPQGCKKLRGRAGYRIRVGDYRVLYRVDDENRIVSVEQIAHRKDAYR